MVRITQYDPRISAEVYSRRRAVEQPFETPVAAGLGQLGRALMAREERREPGHQDKTKAMKVLGRMRKEEFARLKKEDILSDLRERWSAKGYVLEYVSRRDETIAELAKENPRAAKIVAEKSATLTEDLSRRATVIESGHSGQALVADINAAVGDAIETVRTDPTQLGAVLSDFRGTLTELSEDGMDSDATATIIGAAEGKIANAAFRQRLKEDPAAAKEELEAGEFGDALRPEQAEALMAKADHGIKVHQRRAAAESRVTQVQILDGLGRQLEALRRGEEIDDDTYSPENIRINFLDIEARDILGQLEMAEAVGTVFREIAFEKRDEILDEIEVADSDRHLLLTEALRVRDQLLREDPAAYVLGIEAVRRARDAWLQSREAGDLDAARATGNAFASAILKQQREFGVAESDLRVLPDDMADAMVENFTRLDGEGAFAWGEHFRTEFGEGWRIALADVVRAGLPETHAALAQMGRPGQRQAAAQIEAALSGPDEGLRRSEGETAVAVNEAIDTILQDVRGQAGTEPIDRNSSQADIARWRADQLVGIGMAPEAAARQALRELALTPEQYLWLEGPARERGPSEIRRQALIANRAMDYGFDAEEVLAAGSAAQNIVMELDGLQRANTHDYDRLRAAILDLDPGAPLRGRLLRTLDDIFGTRTDDAGPERPGDLDPESIGTPQSAVGREFQRLIENADPRDRARWFDEGLQGLGLDLQWASGDLNPEDANVGFLNAGLTSGDPTQMMFSSATILRAAQEGHEVFKHLSDEAKGSYLQMASERYHSTAPIDPGPGLPEDQHFVRLAERQRNDYAPGLPIEISNEIVLHMSRMPRASHDQALAFQRYIEQVVTPYSAELADRLRGAARHMRAGAGTIARIPGGEMVVDPGRLAEIPGRYSVYMTNADLVLAAVATGETMPSFRESPRNVPEELLSVGFVTSAAMSAADAAGTALSPSKGPIASIWAAAGVVSAGNGIFEAVDDNNQEHTIFLIFDEMVRRHRDETLTQSFNTMFDIAIDIRGAAGDPVPRDPAPE